MAKTTEKTVGRRVWEPMALTRIGSFADVMQGNTGNKADGATMKMH